MALQLVGNVPVMDDQDRLDAHTGTGPRDLHIPVAVVVNIARERSDYLLYRRRQLNREIRNRQAVDQPRRRHGDRLGAGVLVVDP